MKIPTFANLLFSTKCVIASILALYIAMASGLPRPFWAMMTAYIVANPYAGAVRSKAIYRVLGTVLGSVVTILVVPQLANAPELLSLTLALWVGLCLYISLLDRTPRSYVFMLAGYTAGLIGFPAVSDPTSVFDAGLARVEEICIGILSASVIHSIIFPQAIGPGILNRLDIAIADARTWMKEVLQLPKEIYQKNQTRLSLATEITDLRVMSTHLPFDTSNLRLTSGLVHGLSDSVTKMVPLLLAVEDRVQTLQQLSPESLTPRWHTLLNNISVWISSGDKADVKQARVLRSELLQMAPKLNSASSWSDILSINLIQRLDSLIATYLETLELRQSINSAMQGGTSSYSGHATASVLHRDHGMALRSALAAVVAIALCSAFWILTAWPAGAAAPMMAGIFCSFFATQDDPVPAIKMFIKYTLVSIPVAMFYIVSILPAINNFEILALSIAPLFLIVGSYIPNPASGGKAMAFLIGVAGALSLQDSDTLDLTYFLNSMLAQLFGFIAAGVITSLIRTVGNDWMVARMMRAARKEFVEMTLISARPLLNVSVLTVDRIGLLMPRLARIYQSKEDSTNAIENLRELRVGIHITQLREMQSELEKTGISLTPLFEQLGNYFKGKSVAKAQLLVRQIDETLRTVCAAGTDNLHLLTISELTSMRRDLFPKVAAYNPFAKETRS